MFKSAGRGRFLFWLLIIYTILYANTTEALECESEYEGGPGSKSMITCNCENLDLLNGKIVSITKLIWTTHRQFSYIGTYFFFVCQNQNQNVHSLKISNCDMVILKVVDDKLIDLNLEKEAPNMKLSFKLYNDTKVDLQDIQELHLLISSNGMLPPYTVL